MCLKRFLNIQIHYEVTGTKDTVLSEMCSSLDAIFDFKINLLWFTFKGTGQRGNILKTYFEFI